MATTVNSLSDWTTVMPLLLEQGIVGKDVVFGVLVGPSSHSPVPKEILAKVIKVISEKVIKTNGITCLWNGGDPCFRESRRGGNIADVIKGLVTARVVQAGAIQKSQWMPKAPTFNTTRIAYGPNLAKLNGRSVFGGYEVGAKPEGWSTFISKVEEHAVTPSLLPTGNFFPVAASLGYLCLLPALCSKFVMVVIPQAGFISLKEVEYVSLILENNPEARQSVFIYQITWPNMGSNLTPQEKTEKSQLTFIEKQLDFLRTSFPDNVIKIDV
eukprot:TRINITY_DN1267_c0_g1_i1.p1 TRINITY_DN1267_c0_g1~~TRINITY_DN1267_c0_g1_i1.p1  ORF type:complete len:281 (-),score=46.04 TRINITY_DN1267_c0_g1_i1:83-892(-)